MSNSKTKARTPYKESDDHVPNPHYQSGVVDTTGTVGDVGAQIENVSPVFAQHRAAALKRAVDDLDNGNGASVVLPQDDLSREEAEKHLREQVKVRETEAKEAEEGVTPGAREAAEEGEDEPEKGANKSAKTSHSAQHSGTKSGSSKSSGSKSSGGTGSGTSGSKSTSDSNSGSTSGSTTGASA